MNVEWNPSKTSLQRILPWIFEDVDLVPALDHFERNSFEDSSICLISVTDSGTNEIEGACLLSPSSPVKLRIEGLRCWDSSSQQLQEALLHQINTARNKGFEVVEGLIPNAAPSSAKILRKIGFQLVDQVELRWISNEFASWNLQQHSPRADFEVVSNSSVAPHIRLKVLERILADEPLSGEELETELHRCIALDPNPSQSRGSVFSHWLVPKNGHDNSSPPSAPVGLAVGEIERDGTGRLSFLGLVEDVRGKGLGRWLLSEALESFKSRNTHTVLTLVSTTNLKASRLYASFGFQTHQAYGLYHLLLTEGSQGAEAVRT